MYVIDVVNLTTSLWDHSPTKFPHVPCVHLSLKILEGFEAKISKSGSKITAE